MRIWTSYLGWLGLSALTGQSVYAWAGEEVLHRLAADEVEGPILSADGSQWALKVRRGGDWFLVLAQQEIGPFQMLGKVALAGDGLLAVAKEREGHSVVYWGGDIAARYETIFAAELSVQGQQWGAVVEKDGRDYIVVNGDEFGPYRYEPLERRQRLVFAPGESHWGGWGIKASKAMVVLNGQEVASHDEVANLIFTADGSFGYTSTDRDAHHVSYGSRVWGPYDSEGQLVTSIDGKAWGFWTASGHLVVNNQLWGPYDQTGGPVFSRDSSLWGTWISRDGRKFVLVDGEEYGPYNQVSMPHFSADALAWSAAVTKDDAHYLLVGGEEYGPFSEALGVDFAPDSAVRALSVAKEPGAFYYMIGKKEYGPYAKLGPLSFSGEGKKWVFAAERASVALAVVSGKENAAYDEVEAVAISLDASVWGYCARKGEGDEARHFLNINGIEYGPYLAMVQLGLLGEDNLSALALRQDEGEFELIRVTGHTGRGIRGRRATEADSKRRFPV
ncbi:MAG: hypothetical protein HN348_19805, partial [Proteobacteria bacterium]|nr:hypothetical protein [Pseudomonadota bacterium]